MKIEACLTDDIARTLLIPLWCCATPCRANPRAAYDPVAVDVLKQLDFDFSEIRRSFKEYGLVCCLAREMNIDRTGRDFLARHPEGTIINLGCNVTVLDLDFDEEQTYRIVGSQEADPMSGFISEESPFGKALIGHSVGDEVVVEAPAGNLRFKVLDISIS